MQERLSSSFESGWCVLYTHFRCRRHITIVNQYNPDELAFDALYLFEAHVKGSVELTDRFTSIGEVSLNSTRIDGGLFCRGGRFFQHDGVALSMDGLKVGGSVYLDKCVDRTRHLAEAGRTRTSKPVPFFACGTVSMRGATIAHRLFITEAHFFHDTTTNARDHDPLRERERYAFYAKRLRVAGDMFFNKIPEYSQPTAGHSEPSVSHSQPTAGHSEPTDQERPHLAVGPICMENAHIGGRLLLAARPAEGREDSPERPFFSLDFARVEAAAHLEIQPSKESKKAENRVSLRSAKVGSLDVSECAHERLTWDLEGLHYDAIDNVDKVGEDGHGGSNLPWEEVWTRDILRKGEDDKSVAEVMQPYDALMAFLRESGRDEAANRVGITKEKHITENIKKVQSTRHIESLEEGAYVYVFRFAWRKIIEFFVDYGYRPEKSIMWLLGLVLAGTLVFMIASARQDIFDTKLVQYTLAAHSQPEKGKKPYFLPIEPQEYPTSSPFLYSLELATPLPDLGQESHFDIKDNLFLEIYKWFHTIFGWLLSFLIVLSPTKLLRRE